MKKLPILLAPLVAGFALSVQAQVPAEQPEYPSPNEIVEKAGKAEWVAIAPSDLLVMDLAPDRDGKARRVIIQLMPAPFSQGWIGNIRKLAAAHWWDGTAIVRVQDNYVTQWGDPTEEKPLPEGLGVVSEGAYEVILEDSDNLEMFNNLRDAFEADIEMRYYTYEAKAPPPRFENLYSDVVAFADGWPIGSDYSSSTVWPVHCYGMVGVGRNYSPDTGTGAELYTVIGHAPRHLDRNIALVGRIIEGMEHLSSLPRGTGPLGFYEDEEDRVPILSVRLGSELAEFPQLAFEYLSTDSDSFAKYADARANRRDPFFIKSAGGADICNIPVPVRRKPAD